MVQLQLPPPLVLSHLWVYQPKSPAAWHPDRMGTVLGKQSPSQPGVQGFSNPRSSPRAEMWASPAHSCTQRPELSLTHSACLTSMCYPDADNDNVVSHPIKPLHCLHSSNYAEVWMPRSPTPQHTQPCPCAQNPGGPGIHREAGGSSSTTGLCKREVRKRQQGTQQTPRASVQGGEEEESLNERNGDFIPRPCKKCPQALKRVAGRTRSPSALVPWTGERKQEVLCLRVGSSNSRSAATSRRLPTSLFPPSERGHTFQNSPGAPMRPTRLGVVPPGTLTALSGVACGPARGQPRPTAG